MNSIDLVSPTAEKPGYAKLRELVNEEPNGIAGWDKVWKQDVTPWNAGRFQPPLKELITSQIFDLPRSGRALVPGCGRGYETALIASLLGLHTVGIDISPTAIEVAKRIHANLRIDPPGQARFEVVDFFEHAVGDKNRYDLIFDYLFFEAIPPTKREDWGRQMSALIKPGGYLIALIYPIDPESDLGPPFFVRTEHCDASLGNGWAKVLDMVPTTSLPSHIGKERLVVWVRDE